MKKIIFVLCFLLGSYGLSIAQDISLSDKETGKPLAQALLISEEPKAQVTTNAEGKADISAFTGSEKITIRLVGYRTETTSYARLQEAGFIILLVESEISLDQVVVSGTRWNQGRREVPAKITSVTAKEVALQNPQTAADLLNVSGEVFIQKSQMGGGSPMIRGFATNRLLMTVDGVRMNTAIFRSGNIQNVISLDPFAIQNTEVFFGPGSVIYGSDAIGGVMSFQTLAPLYSSSDKPLMKGSGVFRYSSANNEKTGHFDIGLGWRKWASVTSFTHSNFGDLRMGSNGPQSYLRPVYVVRQDSVDRVVTNDDPLVQKPTGYSQTNLMQKISFKPNERWEFQYGFHYSTTTNYARYDQLLRWRNGLPRAAEWNYGPQVWAMNNLNVTHTGNNKVYDQMTLRLAHQYFEESRINRDLNRDARAIRKEKVNAYSANLDFRKTIGAKHKIYYGAEVVTNQVKSTGQDEDVSTGITVDGPSRYPQSTWASYALYATYQYKFSDRLMAQAGLRYNQFVLDAEFDTTYYPFPYTQASISNGALTGSLGLVYSPTETWSISLNGSTGFRSPNVDELGKVFDSQPNSVMVPNPGLEAEYAYNAELGVAKVFTDVLKLELTGYYTLLENAMVRRNFTLNGQDSIVYDGNLSQVQAIQNAAKATVYGFQFGFELKMPYGFGLSSKYNYQVGEEELDNGTTSPSRHAAPMFGVTRLTYTFGKLNMQLYAQYSGEKTFQNLPLEEQGKDYMYASDKNGKPYSPSWVTLNFKALYQLNENFGISAGVENLTDQRYRPYSSGIVAPGRNFIIALRASF